MTVTPYEPTNIFTKILRGDIPCHKVYEDKKSLVFMDILPSSQGHCLVIPKTPSRNIFDIEEADLRHIISVTQKIAKAAKETLKCDGVTIRLHNEKAGGQEVFHTHFHVIPRYEGIPLKPQTDTETNHNELAEVAKKLSKSL